MKKFILLYFITFSVYSSSKKENLFLNFDKHFNQIEIPFLIDDITIKYSKNRIISYDLIKKNIKDEFSPLIIIQDSDIKNHAFKAIGKINLGKENICYYFSHESLGWDGKFNFIGYAVTFNKKTFKVIELHAVYENYETYDNKNFGSIIFDDSLYRFDNKEIILEFLISKENGTIDISEYYDKEYEDKFINRVYQNINLINRNEFSFPTNDVFYKSKKVLLPINEFCNQKMIEKKNEIKNYYYLFYDVNKTNNIKTYLYLEEYSDGKSQKSAIHSLTFGDNCLDILDDVKISEYDFLSKKGTSITIIEN